MSCQTLAPRAPRTAGGKRNSATATAAIRKLTPSAANANGTPLDTDAGSGRPPARTSAGSPMSVAAIAGATTCESANDVCIIPFARPSWASGTSVAYALSNAALWNEPASA